MKKDNKNKSTTLEKFVRVWIENDPYAVVGLGILPETQLCIALSVSPFDLAFILCASASLCDVKQKTKKNHAQNERKMNE